MRECELFPRMNTGDARLHVTRCDTGYRVKESVDSSECQSCGANSESVVALDLTAQVQVHSSAATQQHTHELEVDAVKGAGTCYIGYTVNGNGCG